GHPRDGNRLVLEGVPPEGVSVRGGRTVFEVEVAHPVLSQKMRVAVPENGHFFVRRIDFEKLSSCGAVDVAVQADLKIHPACQVMQVRKLFLAVYDLSGFRVVDEQRALRKAPDVPVRSDEEGSDRRLARD